MRILVLTLALALLGLGLAETSAQRRGSRPATSSSENRGDRAPERRGDHGYEGRRNNNGPSQVRIYSNPGPQGPPPCVETQRVWQEGRWIWRNGRRRWVAGRWVNRQVAVPCPPPRPGFPCAAPTLGPRAFEARTRAIAAESFESTRMTRARHFISHNCLSAAQTRDLLMIFSFESSRLELAKLAYLRSCDRQNYGLVFDAFQFESSARELDAYIRSVGP